MRSAILLGLILAILPCVVFADPDTKSDGGPSQKGPSDQQIQSVLKSDLFSQLASPHPLAFGPGELKEMGARAKAAYKRLAPEVGDPNKDYDVVIQPGHFGRTTGATGGQGKYVSEQEITAEIVEGIADNLRRRGMKVIVIPADGFQKPLKSKIFLSLHTDASTFPCSAGPSLGYSADGDALGMHGIAAALAITLSIDPEKFMRDNYTANLKGYYVFRSMDTKQFKGLLEMSELTCPTQEETLLSRSELLANNLAVAVYFALQPSKR